MGDSWLYEAVCILRLELCWTLGYVKLSVDTDIICRASLL